MQKNAKNKNGLQPIYKPYLKGNPVSGVAAKRALRVVGMVVIRVTLPLGGSVKVYSGKHVRKS